MKEYKARYQVRAILYDGSDEMKERWFGKAIDKFDISSDEVMPNEWYIVDNWMMAAGDNSFSLVPKDRFEKLYQYA